MSSLFTVLCQMLIFTACSRLLVPPGKPTSIYSMFFYKIITYTVNNLSEMCTREDTYEKKKLIFKCIKVVAFIIISTLFLITIGFEQGHHCWSNILYTVITGTYYLLTERTFLDLGAKTLSNLKLEGLEGLEAMYFGIWARGITIALAIVLVPALEINEHHILAMLVVFISVYVRGRYSFWVVLRVLKRARLLLDKFRRATTDELIILDDVCAVCLDNMTSARVTPCAHYFHASCLLKCLTVFNRCPMCMQPFVFASTRR